MTPDEGQSRVCFAGWPTTDYSSSEKRWGRSARRTQPASWRLRASVADAGDPGASGRCDEMPTRVVVVLGELDA